jgi:integrase
MAWRRRRGKKWLVCWMSPVTGKERSRGGFVTAADADAFIRDHVGPCEARGVDWEPPRHAEGASLVTAMNAYLDHVRLTKAPGTERNRTISLELFRRFVTDATPSPTLTVLSKSTLTRFLAWLLTPESSVRGGRSVDAARKAVEHVQGFWAWLADDDAYADQTPRPRKLADLRGMRSPRTPTKAPTWADMDACIAALARPVAGQRPQRDVTYHVLVAVIERCTGLRVSQVDRLLVGDVDLVEDGGVLTIRGELGKSHQERGGRMMPIAPALLPTLRSLVAGREAAELLVPRRQNASEQKRRLRVAQAWAASGVPAAVWKQRPNHAFRKGFSTELARAGVDREVRDFLTGHALGIAGVYTDASALALKAAVAHVAPLTPAAADAVAVVLSTTITARET